MCCRMGFAVAEFVSKIDMLKYEFVSESSLLSIEFVTLI